MKRTMLAVSTLVLAAGYAAPAVGQVDAQVARGATLTRQFCTNHQAMRDALFVSYVVGGGPKSAVPSRTVRRPASDREAISRLARVHDHLMLALRGEKRDRFIPVSIGKPGQSLILRPAAPSPALMQASLANVNRLCDLHEMLHRAFAAGKPTTMGSMRGQIQTAGPNCPHGA